MIHLLSPIWVIGLLILLYIAYDVGYQRGYRKGVFSVRSDEKSVGPENAASDPR